jgi:hypothetical protein
MDAALGDEYGLDSSLDSTWLTDSRCVQEGNRGCVACVVEDFSPAVLRLISGDFTALPDSPENCAGKFLSPVEFGIRRLWRTRHHHHVQFSAPLKTSPLYPGLTLSFHSPSTNPTYSFFLWW